MNRRNLIKNTFIASLASALPFGFTEPSNKKSLSGTEAPGGFKKNKFGDLDLIILTDGHILQQPIQPFMCPEAPQTELESLLKDNFRPLQSVDLAMNVMLVKKDNKYILLDAGMGAFATNEANGWLLNSLSKAGVQAKEITEIMISHAHPDHIGGLIDAKQNLVFPNATVYISKIEYNFWKTAMPGDFKESPLYEQQEFLKQIIGGIQNVLKIIQPKVEFYPETGKLMDTFSFTPIPGHTPGMVMIQVESKGEKLAYIADLIHHDILLFEHPEWGFSGDTNLEEATATRIKTLQNLATSKTSIFAYHLPWPGLGYAGKSNQTFKWIPQVFATI